MQNRTQSTNPWFNQVYPKGCSVGQANLDGPWPRQNVLERKRSFYPRLYIPVQGNYDRPTWYGIKLKIEEKVVHIAQRNQKRGMKEKSVNREKHEKDKMTEDSNSENMNNIFQLLAFSSHIAINIYIVAKIVAWASKKGIKN